MEKGWAAVTLFTSCSAFCFQEGENAVGYEGYQLFLNLDEILAMDTNDERLHAFNTCLDGNGDLIGTQYTLSDRNGTTLDLAELGSISGNCRYLELSDEIEKIEAFYSERTELESAIRFM